VSEASAVGRSVIKVRATDQDTGTNAEITYKIISGDDQGNNVSRYVLRCARKNFLSILLRARGTWWVFTCSEFCENDFVKYPRMQNAFRLLIEGVKG